MAGGKKAKETLIARLGSEEAYKEYMRAKAKKGGKKSNKKKGFGSRTEESQIEVSRKGGIQRGINYAKRKL